MGKILLISILLSITTASAFAEKIMLIQATYLNTRRTYDFGSTEEKKTYGQVGLNVTSFSGKEFGFYYSTTFLMPLSYKSETNGNDSGHDIDDINSTYDQLRIGIDVLMGVGYLAEVTPGFSILAAGGIHFNGLAFISTEPIAPYAAYNLGPGVAINALLYLTESLNINICAVGAWDMIEIYTKPEKSYGSATARGGITWAFSAGFGFTY